MPPKATPRPLPRAFRLLLELFSSRERWVLGGIIGALLVRGVAEMFTVAAVMPFLALVANPTLGLENSALEWLYGTFTFDDDRQFLTYVAL